MPLIPRARSAATTTTSTSRQQQQQQQQHYTQESKSHSIPNVVYLDRSIRLFSLLVALDLILSVWFNCSSRSWLYSYRENSLDPKNSTFLVGSATKENKRLLTVKPAIPLLELVSTGIETSCPSGLIFVNDTISSSFWEETDTVGSSQQQQLRRNNLSRRNIPRIVHVTSKTHCMAQEFYDNLNLWRFPTHSFLFHNEAAVDRFLFERKWPEFPHLQIALRCIKGGAAKADLYRALLMWEYGGIYTDIDNAPAQFHGETSLTDTDDAFFVMEKSAIVSQYFFASRPRHPLFYLYIQHMLTRLLALNDVDYQIVSVVTGPGALRMAFCNFMNGQGPNGPVRFEPNPKCYHPKAKTYNSMGGWNVRVVGDADHADDWVARDIIPNKELIYKRMDMTYFRDLPKVETKRSCFQRLFEDLGLPSYDATTVSTLAARDAGH